MFEKGQEIVFEDRKAIVKKCEQGSGTVMDGDGNMSPVFKVTVVFKDTGQTRTFDVGTPQEVPE